MRQTAPSGHSPADPRRGDFARGFLRVLVASVITVVVIGHGIAHGLPANADTFSVSSGTSSIRGESALGTTLPIVIGAFGLFVGALAFTAAAIAFAQSRKLAATKEHAILALVAENTINGVVFADREGRTTWVNEGFTRMTGYDLEGMDAYLSKPISFAAMAKCLRSFLNPPPHRDP